ncbi:MAG: hypothetical protein E7271_11265 [Lachnospiraceae bacterium]|jgi:hypothetical protein|nr:hypothetical protein [Lachnospiraceae bacterium]
MKKQTKKRAIATVVTCIMALSIIGCGREKPSFELDESEMPTVEDINNDIDVSGLQDAADSIKNLDLNKDSGSDNGQASTDETPEGASQTTEVAGEKTVYSFTDVTRTETGLYMVANGGMNGSTVLFGDKDLNGFLDYVDNTVLEEGRTINRTMFYDILAYMLVDDQLSADETKREKHLMMALAVANNFHDVDVKIKSCVIDANNAADYHYNLTAYGAEDTWLANYQDCTFFMNDGATEYHSDMFKDEYLAVWLMAIEDYYGVKLN